MPAMQPYAIGDLSAAPVLASRLVVVADSYQADALQREFPSARVRVAPIGVDASANVVSPTNEGHLQHLRIGVLGRGDPHRSHR